MLTKMINEQNTENSGLELKRLPERTSLQKATWKYHTTPYMVPNIPQEKRTEGPQW